MTGYMIAALQGKFNRMEESLERGRSGCTKTQQICVCKERRLMFIKSQVKINMEIQEIFMGFVVCAWELVKLTIANVWKYENTLLTELQ